MLDNCSLTEGCELYGTVCNSVLGAGVRVMKGAVICDSILMENVVVGEGARVEYSILDHDVVVGEGAQIGKPRSEASGITVVGAETEVPAGAVIGDHRMISEASEIGKEDK